MTIGINTRVWRTAVCWGLGGIAAALVTAPTAIADQAIPAPPPPPPAQQAIQPAAAEAAPPPVPPAQDGAAPPATEALAAPANGVPHLSSPDNLPPGTTADPVGPQQSRGLSYLRDLWHAMHTQEISGGDALLLLTQRPLDPKAAPPAGMPAGPQGPLPPAPDVPPGPQPAAPPESLPAASPSP